METIDLVICRSDYWLMIYQKQDCWKFALYFPEKQLYCNTNDFCYLSRLRCANSAREVAERFLFKIAEL